MQLPRSFPQSQADFRVRARFRHGLKAARLDASSRLLVAVSGGGDSIALLALLALEAELRGLSLSIGHVDHALRAESADDAAFVELTSAQLGVPFLSRRLSGVPPGGESVEAWAGRERRLALRAMAREVDAAWIVLGHTEDDQAETVLLNLLRGTGLRGLTGMPAARPPVLRPLLGVSRSELRDFCARHALAFREDPSNHDRRFRRNRVRNELLPLIERTLTPAVGRLLARTAANLQPVRALLEREVEAAWGSLRATSTEDGIRLERGRLASYDRAVIEGCLRLGMEQLRGSARDVKHAHLSSLTDAAVAGRPARFHLPHGVTVEVDAAEVRFHRPVRSSGVTG